MQWQDFQRWGSSYLGGKNYLKEALFKKYILEASCQYISTQDKKLLECYLHVNIKILYFEYGVFVIFKNFQLILGAPNQ